MRRFLVMIACSLTGCLVNGATCDEEPCLLAPPAAPCEGQCAPYIGGEWSPVIAAEGAATCPPEAPFATLASDAPPLVACGAPIAPGECSSPGFVCLPPTLPPWTLCVVWDGQHACPGPYPESIEADGVTVCCLAEQPPPG
jgi:hypothetical protein